MEKALFAVAALGVTSVVVGCKLKKYVTSHPERPMPHSLENFFRFLGIEF